MVKAPLVVPDVAFGREVLQALDEAEFRTNVAFWLNDGERWELVVSSPLYEKVGAYQANLKLISALSSKGLSSDPVRLEGNSLPLIKSLRKMFGKTASVEGMRLGNHSIGGQWIDDAYVYRIK